LGIEAGILRLVAGIFTTLLRKHVSSLDTGIRSGVLKILSNKRGIPGSIQWNPEKRFFQIKLESADFNKILSPRAWDVYAAWEYHGIA